MSYKPFSLGIMVGRFQTLHSGHEYMIRTALSLCDEVGIFVGSAQESGTATNPFPYSTRESLLKMLFGDRIHVFPLPDIGVGNNAQWGEYVLQNVNARLGRNPDLLISGKEIRRVGWFDGLDVQISELYIPKTIDISASEMRTFFLKNDEESWKRYTNPKLWGQYARLREQVLACRDVTQTQSM